MNKIYKYKIVKLIHKIPEGLRGVKRSVTEGPRIPRCVTNDPRNVTKVSRCVAKKLLRVPKRPRVYQRIQKCTIPNNPEVIHTMDSKAPNQDAK